MSDTGNDVSRELYPTVIRELIRHENDVTNHRIMWLLIGQGFIGTIYLNAVREGGSISMWISIVGIVLTLSAFLVLYKSYQARGYLLFLGKQAKNGTLREEHLPISGWPRETIKFWRKGTWACPWVERASDILLPWMFLPCLLMFLWLVALLKWLIMPFSGMVLILAAILTACIISVFCVVVVWSMRKDETL